MPFFDKINIVQRSSSRTCLFAPCPGQGRQQPITMYRMLRRYLLLRKSRVSRDGPSAAKPIHRNGFPEIPSGLPLEEATSADEGHAKP